MVSNADRRCSGIHRGMGTHISRVKSVDLDAWTDEQLQSILKWGNARANKCAGNIFHAAALTDAGTGSRNLRLDICLRKREFHGCWLQLMQN